MYRYFDTTLGNLAEGVCSTVFPGYLAMDIRLSFADPLSPLLDLSCRNNNLNITPTARIK